MPTAIPLEFIQPGVSGFVPITIGAITKKWCVYAHWYGDPPIVRWLGVCPLHQYVLAPDASENSEWRRLMTNGANLYAQLIAILETRNDAINHRFRMLKVIQPHCNTAGHEINRFSKVYCFENKETYQSAAHAARTLNIAPSALSNHLSGRVGYKTVGGYTFKKVQ